MRHPRLLALVPAAAIAFVLAPASVTAQQARVVTGTYTTSVNSPQGALKTVIVVKRENGALGGTISADGFPTIPLKSVIPTDSTVSMVADSPDGVSITLKFTGADKVSGTLVYQGMELPIEGTFAADGAPASGGSGGGGGAATGSLVTTVGPTPAGPHNPVVEIAGAIAERTLVVGDETKKFKDTFSAK
ncbi:MAG TPA: hypothetical protein VE861_01340 [Gemmatimonadaceae bacterium]|nr:hypothetical protein [Gemmatimonadaceae bacterium]